MSYMEYYPDYTTKETKMKDNTMTKYYTELYMILRANEQANAAWRDYVDGLA